MIRPSKTFISHKRPTFALSNSECYVLTFQGASSPTARHSFAFIKHPRVENCCWRCKKVPFRFPQTSNFPQNKQALSVSFWLTCVRRGEFIDLALTCAHPLTYTLRVSNVGGVDAAPQTGNYGMKEAPPSPLWQLLPRWKIRKSTLIIREEPLSLTHSLTYFCSVGFDHTHTQQLERASSQLRRGQIDHVLLLLRSLRAAGFMGREGIERKSWRLIANEDERGDNWHAAGVASLFFDKRKIAGYDMCEYRYDLSYLSLYLSITRGP